MNEKMPLITMEAGKLNKEQKEQLIKEFTDSAAKILELPKDAFTVYLKENEYDNIGVGGRLLADVLKK